MNIFLAGTEGLFNFSCDLRIASCADGDGPARLFGQGSGEIGPSAKSRAEEIKNTGCLARRLITWVSGGGSKAGIDRESNRANFIHGDPERVEGACGGFIRDDPKICFGAGPESVDGDGVGHDGDELKSFTQIVR